MAGQSRSRHARLLSYPAPVHRRYSGVAPNPSGRKRMRTGLLVLPHRRYSMPETVMRKYRLRQKVDETDSSSEQEVAVDRGSQTSPAFESWRSYPLLATPSPRAHSSSDCQTVSDKTISTQDSTLSVPSTNSERVPSTGEDVETQVSLPPHMDKNISTSNYRQDYRGNIVELSVNVEADLSDNTVADSSKRKEECMQIKAHLQDVSAQSTSCQSEHSCNIPLPPKHQDSNESQQFLTRTKDEFSQVDAEDFFLELYPPISDVHLGAEIACPGANYDEYPVEKPVIPRYSAVPRTNSMLVNTSSVEFSSDSELSLTDSLEDPEEFRTYRWKQNSRHDERLVRGEVAVELERRRLPKSRDAYAYFLSLTGEEDAIREYSVPDWLRERLRRREEEIKKLYEDKFSRHQQCGYFRRRKKVIKRVKQRSPYSSSDKIRKNGIHTSDNKQKNEKTVHFDSYGNNNASNNDVMPGSSDKCAVRLINGNNMGMETKVNNTLKTNNMLRVIENHDNINNNHNHNYDNNQNNESNSSHLLINRETSNRNGTDTNLLHISEIIKIEMSENSTALITKEKQINIPFENNIKQKGSEVIRNELSNSTKILSSKSDPSTVSTELVETSILSSSHEIFAPEGEVKYFEPKCKRETSKQIEKKVHEPLAEEKGNKCQEGFSSSSRPKGQEISLDRKIADILINALEENTKAHKLCRSSAKDTTASTSETTIESHSRISVHQKSQLNEKDSHANKSVSISVQTDKIHNIESNNSNEKKLADKSCITEPYLVSVRIQTYDGNNTPDSLEEEFTNEHGGFMEGDIPSYPEELTTPIESITNLNDARMIDKASNTVEWSSISTQTLESILRTEDILNGLKKSKTHKKREVQFPPQVIRQIITGTGEYKTIDHTDEKSKDKDRGKSEGGKKVKMSKGTNTEEDSGSEYIKSSLNKSNNELHTNKGRPTPFCKNSFSNKSLQKKSQVLELNVPACSCHMCTLQKISPRGETSKCGVTLPKKSDNLKDERKAVPKIAGRRNNAMSTKFQMFEVIPEERTSSNDSAADERANECIKMEEKAVLTETNLIDQIVQVGYNNASVATNTEPLETKFYDLRNRTLQERWRREEVTQTDSKCEGTTQTEGKREEVTQTESKREEFAEGKNFKEEVTQTDNKRESVAQTENNLDEIERTHTLEDHPQAHTHREWSGHVECNCDESFPSQIKGKEVPTMGNMSEEATQTDSKRERITQTDSKREEVTQTDNRRERITQTESKSEQFTKTDNKQEDVLQKHNKRERINQEDVKRDRATHKAREKEVTLAERKIRESTQVEKKRVKRTQQMESKQTVSQRKSSNLVIGRFRSDTKESPMLVSQYKGRASLSAGHLEGQEELVTLSKGWINFYLLKDNFDISDSNEEPSSVRKQEDVEEYTLEIHATPEPPRPGLLPNLRQSGVQTSGNGFPEIGRSGSTSPGDSPSQEEQDTRRRQVGPLPGVRERRMDTKKEGILKERRAGHHSSQTSRAVEVAEQSISSISSSTVVMSESPPPQLLKLPDRKSSQKRLPSSLHLRNGSSWTVTVAGNNGSGNDPPPDVEMKLIFGKQARTQDESQVQRPKRQGQMIEEYSRVLTNEKHAVQCVQDLSFHTHSKNLLEKSRLGSMNFDEDYINRLSSRRSRYSTEDGTEIADLHVTGLAITPEKKPRVPTQSERDILRPQRYKFTR